MAAAKLNVAEYANASLQEVVDLLDRKSGLQDMDSTDQNLARYPVWVRDFTIQYAPESLPPEQTAEQASFHQDEEILLLFEPAEQHIAEQLERCFLRSASSAILECVSYEEVRRATSSFLTRFTCVIALLPHRAVDEAVDDQQSLVEHVRRLHTIFFHPFHLVGLRNRSLAVVQFGDGFFGNGPVTANVSRCSAKAMAASLHLEQPDLKIRVLDFSPQIAAEQLCTFIITELSTAENYAAVGYAADQIRRVPRPVLRNIAEDKPRSIKWSAKDVVLATGGAKGITAECALAFARAAHVQLALVGSSLPAKYNEQHDE